MTDIIERIAKTDFTVRIPNCVCEWTDEEFDNKLWLTIRQEIDCYLRYMIMESCKKNKDNECPSYEYKISLLIEKCALFKIFCGEWTE